MDEFLPYFTQDGSIGLYSSDFQDIYHSAFGAYSEAVEKFILPANIENLLNKNQEIKILDLCYGIGYNTKSFLNFFINKKIIKNKTENFSKNFSSHTEYNESIHTDNTCKNHDTSFYNATIHTDNNLINIETKNNKNYLKQKKFFNKFRFDKIFSEIFRKYNVEKLQLIKSDKYNLENKKSDKKFSYKITIDAFDINERLVKLSPLFKIKKTGAKIKLTKNNNIDKFLSKGRSRIQNRYPYYQEVNFIILMTLLDKYREECFNEDIQKIIANNKFSIFFDKELVAFISFYLSDRYNFTLQGYKHALLHNIYYRYLSISYKKALNILKTLNFNFNYFNGDARRLSDIKSCCNYNLIFLDAFTPTKAPNLWSYDFLHILYEKLDQNGVILTYTNSACVRNAFLKNGFYVGKIFNKHDNKFTGTIATKNPDLIEHNLDSFDLGLINSKSGIMFRDKNLNLTNEDMIRKRDIEKKDSNLISSSKFIKKYKGENNAL